jgi:hypothetical protein
MNILFPQLPSRYRTGFALATGSVVALLITAAVLKLQAALVGLVALGLTVVFVLYLTRIAVARRLLVPVAAAAVVSGVVWGLAVETVSARVEPDALGNPIGRMWEVLTGLTVALSFVALLLLPVFAARRFGRGPRSPLTGYAVGALSGFCFTSAGTLTRLAALFAEGLTSEANRLPAGLAIAAAIQGLAIPLTAAAVAGAVGAALWSGRDRWPAVGVALLAYAALGLLDASTWPYEIQMACYAGLTVVAVVWLRIVVHPHVISPDVADDAPTVWGTAWALGWTATGLVVVTGVCVALTVWLTPPLPSYTCPPDCGTPPVRTPVAINPRFTAPSGDFSVSYPGEGTAYTTTFDADGLVAELTVGDGGTLRLFGEPAVGRSAREVVEEYLQRAHPDARLAYEIPNALVGYRLGYGEVADVYPAASIDASRLRVLVMAAVKDDYALIAAGTGPYREFSPDFGSGHPSGANFLLALDMGKYVNSFMWRGDPPR